MTTLLTKETVVEAIITSCVEYEFRLANDINGDSSGKVAKKLYQGPDKKRHPELKYMAPGSAAIDIYLIDGSENPMIEESRYSQITFDLIRGSELYAIEDLFLTPIFADHTVNIPEGNSRYDLCKRMLEMSFHIGEQLQVGVVTSRMIDTKFFPEIRKLYYDKDFNTRGITIGFKDS